MSSFFHQDIPGYRQLGTSSLPYPSPRRGLASARSHREDSQGQPYSQHHHQLSDRSWRKGIPQNRIHPRLVEITKKLFLIVKPSLFQNSLRSPWACGFGRGFCFDLSHIRKACALNGKLISKNTTQGHRKQPESLKVSKSQSLMQ